jgi:hypothetical protein
MLHGGLHSSGKIVALTATCYALKPLAARVVAESVPIG